MNQPRQALCVLFAVLTLPLAGAALADNGTELTLFTQAAAALQSPKLEALRTGALTLRTGETAYVPSVAPEITPYDERDAVTLPAVDGTFETTDPGVVTVDDQGLLITVSAGEAAVTYHTASGDVPFTVTVADDAMPQTIRALIYVARHEYYGVHRTHLPKYNQYTKWYYGKKKEVDWCSVFTIWCANFSGNNPIDEEDVSSADPKGVVLFREGQVGNQYDGFSSLGRFVGVPRPGYLVLYANLSNGYRTTHIGIIVGTEDRGNGLYKVTTVEGNMSNTVKSYCYLYNSGADNHTVGVEKGKKLHKNMSVLPTAEQTDPLLQYELHTDHWAVFGFGATWQ